MLGTFLFVLRHVGVTVLALLMIAALFVPVVLIGHMMTESSPWWGLLYIPLLMALAAASGAD